jgi:hypothetical protein
MLTVGSFLDRPFLRPDVLTPSSSTGSRSVSPSPGRRSPYRAGPPPRSHTLPLPAGPPSPELSNLDCAFPPFPTSGRATPGADRRGRQNTTSPRPPPMNPARSPVPPAPSDPQFTEEPVGMHKRDTSTDSKRSFQSVATSRYGDPISRPSTANSLRRPSVGSTRGPRNVLAEVPPVPAGPLKSFRRDSQLSTAGSAVSSSPPNARKAGYSGFDFGITYEPQNHDESVDPLDSNSNLLTRSQTMPVTSNTLDSLDATRNSFMRRPSQPSTVPGRPLFADNHGTEQTSHEGNADEMASSAKPNAGGSLTVSNFARALGLDNTYHAAGHSTSSTESSPSDTGSGSSLSSPPSEAGRKPSDLSQIDEMLKDLEMDQAISPSDEKPLVTGLEPPQIPDLHRGPDSPTDPSLGGAGFSLLSERVAPPKSPLRTKTPITEPISRPGTAMGQKRRCRGCEQIITGKSVSSADGRLTGRYHKACFVCHTCRAPFQTADFYVLDDHPYCAQHYHELNGSLCATCNRGIEGQYLETIERSGRGAGDRQKFHPDCLTCRTCRIVLRGDYFEWNGQVYCERDARRAASMTPPPGGRRRPTMPSSPLARPPGFPPGPPGPGRGPGPRNFGPGGPGPGPRGSPYPGGPGGPPSSPKLLAPGPRRFPERRTTKLMMI